MKNYKKISFPVHIILKSEEILENLLKRGLGPIAKSRAPNFQFTIGLKYCPGGQTSFIFIFSFIFQTICS